MSGVRVVDASPQRAPARGLPIEPRIRARLIEVQRDRGRRRRRILLGIGAGMAVLAVGWGSTRSPLLAVRHVSVTGAARTSREAVLAASGLDHRRQMLDIGPGQVRARLEALPWVGQARVARQWPTTVAITVTERVVVAQVAGPAGQMMLVDADGRVLATGAEAKAVLAGVPRPPQLIGLSPVSAAIAAGGVVAQARGGLLSLAVALPDAVAETSKTGAPVAVEAVTVAPDGTLKAVLSTGVALLFGSVDEMAAKLVAVRTVLAQVNLAGVATVDVRVPDTPVLTKANGGSMVSTIPRG